MLPAAHRLTDADSFRETVRRGRRASSATVVTHVLLDARRGEEPRVGFVVSKAVGNSVVRSRVQRRLRHLMREHLGELASGSAVVVRALPAAASASSSALAADLASTLRRVGTGPREVPA